MIEHEHIAAKWWRWWANPFVGLHTERLEILHRQGIDLQDQSRYEGVLRVRRMLALPAVPDETMLASPDKLLLALLEKEALHAGIAGLGCIALNDSILTARSQDWEDLHHVHNSDMIRDLVSNLRGLSPVLETIRLDILGVFSSQITKPLTIQEAVTIVLGLYIREFSLPFYQRWLLTVSCQAEALLSYLPRINKEHVPEFEAWVDTRLAPLIDAFIGTHDIPLLDLNELRENHAEAA